MPNKTHKQVLIGIAWPYVNGDIHVGHLGGYLIPADIVARFQRLQGNDVLMVSGSDCYGTPITVQADKEGLTPIKVVDKYHPNDVALFKQYRLSYNLYTKTTTENHKCVVHKLFLRLLEQGYIVKDTMQQYYSADDDEFLPDRYVEGTCPHCNAKEQRSDQCESCGRWLTDGEILDPVSKLTGAKITLKETEHYFLDFAKLTPQLREYLDNQQQYWRDWVWKESDGWLREGLQKRAITRDLDWGVELPIDEIKKLPEDKQLTDFEGKRIYVWFEAVIGYLSAPQEWEQLDEESEDIIFRKDLGQADGWEDWWKNPDCVIYNFMGQDNLVFHTLMWPGELLGADQGFTLPRYVVVNKFMNYEGRKFSKSRNWTVNSKVIGERYGVDLVRYYISSILPENKEANFTWEGFVDAVNNELVANVGNFINRTFKFIESKYDGKLKVEDYQGDEELKREIEAVYKKTREMITKGDLVKSLQLIMKLSGKGNKMFDEYQPWVRVKEDKETTAEQLLDLTNLILNLAVLLAPYLPDAAKKIAAMTGDDVNDEVGVDNWRLRWVEEFDLKQEVEPVFKKLDREEVLKRKDLD